MGFFQAKVLEWGAIAFSGELDIVLSISLGTSFVAVYWDPNPHPTHLGHHRALS